MRRALANWLTSLEARMAPRGRRIVIEGGLDPAELARRRTQKPGGSDLRAQHAIITKPRRAGQKS
jgi:hypothetical protein